MKFCLSIGLTGIAATALLSPAAEPELPRLKRHVATLAAPEYAGRREHGAELARDYLIAEFRKLGLRPLFGESFRQDVLGAEPGEVLGVNVGARLDPTDPKFADEWIAESRSGRENFHKLEDEGKAHQIETVGKELRSLMPWISAGKQSVTEAAGGQN